jgi:tetratricopeptide (TPR) repeat protein
MMTSNPIQQLDDQAMALFKEDEFDQAAALFQQAAEKYQESGESNLAAEARNNQSVALLQAGNPEDALAAALGTETIFAAAGDIVRQAQALGNQAAAHEALHHLDQAASLYLQAAEIFKSSNEFEFYSLVMKNVSSIRMRQRKLLDSLFAMNQALSVKPKLTFRERIIRSLSNLAFRMFTRPPAI